MKTLSEKLKQWRCERPDEWKMDEFIRYAEELEQECELLVHENADKDRRIADLREIQRLRAENEALKINVAIQLPKYKALREAFMDGVYWYEQSNIVSQVALDKAAHEYANSVFEKQTTKKQSK